MNDLALIYQILKYLITIDILHIMHKMQIQFMFINPVVKLGKDIIKCHSFLKTLISRNNLYGMLERLK